MDEIKRKKLFYYTMTREFTLLSRFIFSQKR